VYNLKECEKVVCSFLSKRNFWKCRHRSATEENTGVTLDRAEQLKCRDAATEEYWSETLWGSWTAEKVMTNHPSFYGLQMQCKKMVTGSETVFTGKLGWWCWWCCCCFIFFGVQKTHSERSEGV